MAKVQIIMAMKLDGFFLGEDEELFKWVKTDKRGSPFWHGRSTFMLPIGYPMLDLICEKGHLLYLYGGNLRQGKS